MKGKVSAADPSAVKVVDRINRDLREKRQRVDLRDLDELAGVGRE